LFGAPGWRAAARKLKNNIRIPKETGYIILWAGWYQPFKDQRWSSNPTMARCGHFQFDYW
jgi:hypothetical protein